MLHCSSSSSVTDDLQPDVCPLGRSLWEDPRRITSITATCSSISSPTRFGALHAGNLVGRAARAAHAVAGHRSRASLPAGSSPASVSMSSQASGLLSVDDGVGGADAGGQPPAMSSAVWCPQCAQQPFARDWPTLSPARCQPLCLLGGVSMRTAQRCGLSIRTDPRALTMPIRVSWEARRWPTGSGRTQPSDV